MFRYTLSLLMFLHGSIHLVGTAKAYGYDVASITQNISTAIGSFWLITAFLFITASILLLIGKEGWFLVATMAVIASQILIIMYWADAKWGSAVNLIILLALVIEFYRKTVSE
jgi:hypothetical protein